MGTYLYCIPSTMTAEEAHQEISQVAHLMISSGIPKGTSIMSSTEAWETFQEIEPSLSNRSDAKSKKEFRSRFQNWINGSCAGLIVRTGLPVGTIGKGNYNLLCSQRGSKGLLALDPQNLKTMPILGWQTVDSRDWSSGFRVLGYPPDRGPKNLIWRRGDIFKEGPDVILTVPVNCQGVMGAGLAKAYKDRYPEGFQAYAGCMMMIGQPVYWAGTPRSIFFPTKDQWKLESTAAYIREGVMNFSSMGVPPGSKVAVPALGCGLGGLNFRNQVWPLLNLLADLNPDILFHVYPPRNVQ